MIDLKEVARDFCEGRILTSDQVDHRMWNMVFMPLLFVDPEKLKDVALIFGYMKNAGPRCINGYPQFMEIGVIKKDNIDELNQHIKKYRDLINSY